MSWKNFYDIVETVVAQPFAAVPLLNFPLPIPGRVFLIPHTLFSIHQSPFSDQFLFSIF